MFILRNYIAIVIGGSAGGFQTISPILQRQPKNFPQSILVTLHLHEKSISYFPHHLNKICKLRVKEADEKEAIEPGTVYFAPPNYHMLVEDDHTISFTADEKINYCRPSIDVLFETAADVYAEKLVGVILTGANNDGSNGLKKIKDCGGLTIVQNPKTAAFDEMPRSAIATTQVDHILEAKDIPKFLLTLNHL